MVGPQDRPPAPADHLDEIFQYVESLSRDLRDVSLSIHDNPELQYKEFHAHKVLTDFLGTRTGWQVTPSAYGIKTAFVAVYSRGTTGPTVSFNAEYGVYKLTDPRSVPH